MKKGLTEYAFVLPQPLWTSPLCEIDLFPVYLDNARLSMLYFYFDNLTSLQQCFDCLYLFLR